MQKNYTAVPGMILDNGGASPEPEVLNRRILKLLREKLGPINYERLQFYRHIRHVPDLKQPKSFNEKVAWRKIFANPPDAAFYSDKVAVRDYVSRTVGDQYLTESLMVTDQPSDIRLHSLPSQFVAKANHGCAMNLIVTDKTKADAAFLHTELSRFLKTVYGRLTNEPWYVEIKPSILVEEFLQGTRFVIPDEYKFYVYHGETRVVQVNTDVLGVGGRAFYDPEWRRQEISFPSYARGPFTDPPDRLNEMIEVANALGSKFDFVRVDLFALGKRVVFSELTLSPNAGWRKFDSRFSDDCLGSFW